MKGQNCLTEMYSGIEAEVPVRLATKLILIFAVRSTPLKYANCDYKADEQMYLHLNTVCPWILNYDIV